MSQIVGINRLLTEREGQYSPVRPEQARLVSCLLYGIMFLIVKCSSDAINLFSSLSFSFSIFLASSGSFTVKNDNIHSFFSLFWLQIMNLPALLQNKNTWPGPFPRKWSVLQNPERERTNQSAGICPRLALPYNNINYPPRCILFVTVTNINTQIFFCNA